MPQILTTYNNNVGSSSFILVCVCVSQQTIYGACSADFIHNRLQITGCSRPMCEYTKMWSKLKAVIAKVICRS